MSISTTASSDSTVLPEPPYYAVIFCSMLNEVAEGYAETAQRMLALAEQQPGFLGVDSAREQGRGITVSWWRDLESIQAWKQQAEHLQAQRMGRLHWYREFRIHIARVERAYAFTGEAECSPGTDS